MPMHCFHDDLINQPMSWLPMLIKPCLVITLFSSLLVFPIGWGKNTAWAQWPRRRDLGHVVTCMKPGQPMQVDLYQYYGCKMLTPINQHLTTQLVQFYFSPFFVIQNKSRHKINGAPRAKSMHRLLGVKASGDFTQCLKAMIEITRWSKAATKIPAVSSIKTM